MKRQKRVSKERVRKLVDELISLAKTVTPDVTAEVQIPGYEDQHAWRVLYVPSEYDDRIDDLISQRVYEIFVATGYHIGALVYDKSESPDVSISANA
jgi:hypothetical protein